MTPKISHPWDLSEQSAIQLQIDLSKNVITNDQFWVEPKLVAGVDVAYSNEKNDLFAGIVTIDSTNFKVVEKHTAIDVARFPYTPGLFSFRELPSIISALGKLRIEPDLIVCDSQGIAHPRRFGLASHLGVLFDIPTIGCAKTRYIGEYSKIPTKRGEQTPLIDESETVGAVLCTQNDVKPVFVSVGHKVSIETACNWILKLAPDYRLPETTRLSNELVNLLRQSAK